MIERKVCNSRCACRVIDFAALRAGINVNDMDKALIWAKKEISNYEIIPERVCFEKFDDGPDMPNTHVSMFTINNETAYYRICVSMFGPDAVTPEMKRKNGTYKRDRITYMLVTNYAEIREKYPERVARLLKNGAYLALCDTDPIRARAQFL